MRKTKTISRQNNTDRIALRSELRNSGITGDKVQTIVPEAGSGIVILATPETEEEEVERIKTMLRGVLDE